MDEILRDYETDVIVAEVMREGLFGCICDGVGASFACGIPSRDA